MPKIHQLKTAGSSAPKSPKPAAKSPKQAVKRREVHSFAPLLPQPAPAHMEPEAASIFVALTEELSKTGTHSMADLPAIELLADATAGYRAMRRQMLKEGIIVENNKGSKVNHPGLYFLNGERGTMLSLASLLMMTPKSRGGLLLKTIAEVIDDPVDEGADDEVEEEAPRKLASGEF